MSTTYDISKLSQITYSNFEISLVVFMPNNTTNHGITYTNIIFPKSRWFFSVSCFLSILTRQAQHLRDLPRAKWLSFSSVSFSSRYQVNSIALTMVSPFSRKNRDQEAFRLLTWPLWYYDRFVCLSFFFRAPGISGTRVCESKHVFSGFGRTRC